MADTSSEPGRGVPASEEPPAAAPADGLGEPSWSVLETPHYGIWVADTDERTVYANEALMDLLGTRDVIGRSVLDFFAEAEHPLFEHQSAMRSFGVSEEYEIDLLTADGFRLPVLVSATPRFDADGTYLGSTALIRDLRSEKLADAELRSSLGHEALSSHEHHIQRYLTTGLAHALNTTLQAITGLAGVLERDERVPAALQGTVGKLGRAIDECAALVENLMEVAQDSTGEPEAVALASLLDGALASRAAYLPANNVTLHNDLEPGILAWAEPARLRRAVRHLVNALVEPLLERGGGSLALQGRRSSDRVEVVLKATGPHLAMDIVAFAPSDVRPGMDPVVLSYAVAHRIVTEAEGALEAENVADGCLVRLELPAPPEGISAQQPEPSVASIRPAGETKLLVVDDEPFILELNRELLGALGSVTTAASADEAIELLSEETFDLVITDLRMPGALDGMGLYHWVVQERPELADRVVFTTADTLSPQASAFLKQTPQPHMRKPFNIQEYRAFVIERLAR